MNKQTNKMYVILVAASVTLLLSNIGQATPPGTCKQTVDAQAPYDGYVVCEHAVDCANATNCGGDGVPTSTSLICVQQPDDWHESYDSACGWYSNDGPFFLLRM